MTLIFTAYVRSQDSGVEPTAEDFDEVLDKLGDALRSEMVKRSLWSAPPSYLGICGWSSWSQAEAFEELLYDCYSFNFVHRLAGLAALLEIQENIEGVVFRNLGFFLFEKQKAHDPVGYRTFRVLRTAVRESVTAGELWVLVGDARVGNATVLGPESPDSTSGADGLGPIYEPEGLTELVREWSDELMPDLVTARGKKLNAVVARLRHFLVQLEAHGIRCFLFKDVVDPLKQAIRWRWTAVWQSSQGEMGFEGGDEEFTELVRLVRPDSGFEEREVFLQLLACVEGALDRLAAREKARDAVARLWVFLRSRVAEDELAGTQPSWREIASELGIPRSSLLNHRATLGHLVETCHEKEM